MKWTNNNLSNGKSVFYTDTSSETTAATTQPTEMKIANRKSQLATKESTKEVAKVGTLRRKRNMGLLDYEMERKCREEQLSKVLKALAFVEAKLRNEQQIIRRQLCEKDELINRQMCTIRNMKRKYGDTEDVEENVSEVAEYCPKCRKNYYLYEPKTAWTQTLPMDDYGAEEQSFQSIEYMSSSEEAESLNSFMGARHSRKYTSKRSFKDYQLNKARDPSSSERSFILEPPDKSSSDKENQLSESNYDSTTGNVYSSFMNNMHGIKSSMRSPRSNGPSSLQIDDGEGPKSISDSHNSFSADDTVLYNNTTQKPNDDDCDISQKYTKGIEVRQKIEPSDDWYASASDADENDNGNGYKQYGQTGGNPVLECMNQILLQEPMEEKEKTTPTTPTKSPSTPRSKRVHFSMSNTMVQVPRAQYPIMEQDEIQMMSYDIPIAFTNDYEPVGSSNHYVDMDSSKQGSEDNEERKVRKPPALPPKPANLMRLPQMPRPRVLIRTKVSPTIDGSEPDYCSISDVKEAKTVQIVAEIHKSADDDYSTVRDENRSDNSSEMEESFEDVPKLPMVEEIITPKKKDINRYIGRDNYITKSPYKYQVIRSSLTNRQKIAQILAEITKTTTPSKPVNPTYDSPLPTVSPSDTNEHHHKSAFDWYHADNQSMNEEKILEEKVERPSDPITQDPIFYSGDEAEDYPAKKTSKPPSIFKNHLVLAETPAKVLTADKSFQFFLEDSGLSSKAILPRKKRVYYTGPFV